MVPFWVLAPARLPVQSRFSQGPPSGPEVYWAPNAQCEGTETQPCFPGISPEGSWQMASGSEVQVHYVWPGVEGKSRVALRGGGGVPTLRPQTLLCLCSKMYPFRFGEGTRRSGPKTGIYLSSIVPEPTGSDWKTVLRVSIIIFNGVVITQKKSFRLGLCSVKGEGVRRGGLVDPNYSLPHSHLPACCNSSICGGL